MPPRIILPIAVLALAGCSPEAEVQDRTRVEATAKTGTGGGASASATASSAEGSSVKEENDLYVFEYSWPAQAAALPGLVAWLEQDRDRARDELVAEAKEDRAGREQNDFPYHPHSFGEEWKAVADLPGWLSLSGEFHTFSGGAHGMYGVEGLVWDKAGGRGFKSEELFQSPGYLGSTMGDRVCAALNKEREKRRGEPVDPNDEFFGDCPELDEATILVGSSNGRTFDRITVYFGPYVAGPYAEGAYELDFPMTQEMLEAVKPAYRAAFSAKG